MLKKNHTVGAASSQGRFLAVVLLVYLWASAAVARYEPTWESLDARPLPAWYDQAKVGIFLHWGVYSVPGYVSEWFWWYWMDQGFPTNKKVPQFMEDNYPPGFTYPAFAKDFTCEFFDPNEWARIFEDSGARYVVLTSKHHEGYTLWPSNVSFNWNSMDVGPKRDLVGELANAIRSKTHLVFGLYHSLFEWFNPLYRLDKSNNFTTDFFVKMKTMPELFELVKRYKPEVVWSDGDAGPPDYWRSREFLAWLYNDSPVKDTVVTNDRWGDGCTCKHGGYFTCDDRYNPAVSDYSPFNQFFVFVLVRSLLSCGGNILINVGPTHDGRIAPIFQERLAQLGSWLRVNGEAVYGSKAWKCQNDTLANTVWRYIRSPGTGRPPSGPPKTPQSCFDIDHSRSEAYLQARTLHPSSPETTKPCRMDTQEAPSEQEWRLVGSDQRLKDNITVVMKFTDGTALGTLPPDTIGNSVLQAAGLNSAERKDTFIKIRTIQNLIAIDTYRQSAAEKILRLQEVQMHGQTRSLIAYQASGKDTIKGVINGIQVSVPDEIIQRSLEVQGAKILQARRIASSKTILITLEGNRLPRYALYGRVVMRLYPYKPRSLFCHICAVIGHRADVCPNKPHFTTCLNCGTKLPPGSSENTPHNCEIQCQNCGGEHPANYPQCPARQEADHARREEERNRKRRQQAPPKKDPETHNRGRSRNRDRSQRRRSKSATGIQWPSLPTNNRYTQGQLDDGTTAVYVFVLEWPWGSELRLGSLNIDMDTEITMLGAESQAVTVVSSSATELRLKLPALTPDLLPSSWAWVLRVTGTADCNA
ncbi:hypothetical protein HPB47_022771 [Ixodes persulcatus]|uniref:Uncharacterized protein n=1 Tax=Ixodes persulcatus TaxID=34615 RepID=A0AC60QB28_IXOPE|nr:hypothetical protein HPB47_022771 [Ixodes persulcatus]